MADFKVPEISYTSRDYESIRDDLIKAIPFFVPEWTNHNPSDFGISILELNSYGLDVLHYYNDRQAMEFFITSAIKRESVAALLALIDYRMKPAIPATVDLVFTLAELNTSDVLIPAGTKLRTSSGPGVSPVIFETTEDLTIPSGTISGTVGAIEGETIGSPTPENIGFSDGLQLQRFEIPFDRVIEDSLKLTVNEGAGDIEWIAQDGLILSGPTDLHYYIETQGTPERLIVNFGDNVQGKIPSPGSSIDVELRVLTSSRGGSFGNVGATTITELISTITVGAVPVSLSVTNPLSASGGEGPESIQEAKIKGPRSLRALNRAVSEEDYKILSENFPGVSLANAFVVNDDETFCCSVCVVIYPEGGGTSSSVLKEELALCLNQKKMATTRVEIKDAIEKKINIEGTIYIRDNFEQEQVRECVDNEIDNFFEIRTGPIDIGRNINLSDIYPIIMNCYGDGVSYVNITKLTIQPEATLRTWTGDTIFESISQGQNSKEESWFIVFNTPTTFSVTGSVSGLQSNVGTVGTVYTTDDPTVLSFKIASDPNVTSPVPNSTGDYASFDTKEILNNVEIPRDCIAIKGNILFQYIGGTKTTVNC